jgi:hypothetical protein
MPGVLAERFRVQAGRTAENGKGTGEVSVMRNRVAGLFVAAITVFIFSPHLPAQIAPSPATSGTSDNQKFDPHDLNGTWIGAPPKPGFRNLASFDRKLPEPPLTVWAKQRLLYKSILHDPLQGTLYPDKVGPGHDRPSTRDPSQWGASWHDH